MTPDLTHRPASRARRGPARLIAALALVAVTAACSSGNDDVTPVRLTPAPSSTMTASPADVTEVPPEPTATQSESIAVQAGGIEGPYTLRIPRIGVDAQVVPIQANEERVLNPHETPASPDGGATALPQANCDRRYWSDTPYATRRGVFDDIGDLTRGDAIKVEGTDATLTYRVRSIDVLSKEEVARRAEEIFLRLVLAGWS